MSTSLTPDQEKLIQVKLQTGKYHSAEEVLETAFQLLEEYDRADASWLENVRVKVDEAVSASEHTPPIDGETFINGILEPYHKSISMA
jgi:antitoxin ParD1/3/4